MASLPILLAFREATIVTQMKILVIDGDPDYRACVRRLLEDSGYAVREAASGDDGLDVVREDPPDLIVMDVIVESLTTGYSVIQALRSLPEYQASGIIPVVLASSVAQDPASLLGWIGDTSPITPDAHLSKPLDVSEFLGTIEKLLSR